MLFRSVYVYMKHFALNDQETARDGISVWTNEQAAREIYLQAFEYPVVESGAYSVMTSFNRMGCTWAGGDKGLLTGILRSEWGMPGFALTDFSNSNNYMDVVNGVLAGGDAWDCNDSTIGGDKQEKVKMSEYLEIIRDNKPMQRLMVAGAGCKLALAIATNTTVLLALYGILMGNYNSLIWTRPQINLETDC